MRSPDSILRSYRVLLKNRFARMLGVQRCKCPARSRHLASAFSAGEKLTCDLTYQTRIIDSVWSCDPWFEPVSSCGTSSRITSHPLGPSAAQIKIPNAGRCRSRRRRWPRPAQGHQRKGVDCFSGMGNRPSRITLLPYSLMRKAGEKYPRAFGQRGCVLAGYRPMPAAVTPAVARLFRAAEVPAAAQNVLSHYPGKGLAGEPGPPVESSHLFAGRSSPARGSAPSKSRIRALSHRSCARPSPGPWTSCDFWPARPHRRCPGAVCGDW